MTIPDSGIDYYLGIQYAAPPIGALRFQAPRAPDKRDDDTCILANVIPNVCPQANRSHPLLTRDTYGDENCLFLNVFKPSSVPEGTQLPVMVYIRPTSLL